MEDFNSDRLQTKWLLKTTPNAWQEWPRIEGLEKVAQGSLKEHWKLRGVEERPNREVSAWPSFLASYSEVKEPPKRRTLSMKALPSADTESVAVEVSFYPKEI